MQKIKLLFELLRIGCKEEGSKPENFENLISS